MRISLRFCHLRICKLYMAPMQIYMALCCLRMHLPVDALVRWGDLWIYGSYAGIHGSFADYIRHLCRYTWLFCCLRMHLPVDVLSRWGALCIYRSFADYTWLFCGNTWLFCHLRMSTCELQDLDSSLLAMAGRNSQKSACSWIYYIKWLQSWFSKTCIDPRRDGW